MKKIVLTVIMCLATTLLLADDFEKSQHNFRVRSGNHGLELREEINSDKDHIQYSYFGVKNTEMRMRYVDNLESKEYRPQVSYMMYRGQHLFLKPRLDYRYFIGEKPDYFSFRTSFGWDYFLSPKHRLWSEINPIWEFGQGRENDFNLDKAQFRLGVDYVMSDIIVGPFIQYETNNHFERTDTFLGTNVTLKF